MPEASSLSWDDTDPGGSVWTVHPAGLYTSSTVAGCCGCSFAHLDERSWYRTHLIYPTRSQFIGLVEEKTNCWKPCFSHGTINYGVVPLNLS